MQEWSLILFLFDIYKQIPMLVGSMNLHKLIYFLEVTVKKTGNTCTTSLKYFFKQNRTPYYVWAGSRQNNRENIGGVK